MGRPLAGHTYVVKNTFVELKHCEHCEDAGPWMRRERSASETTAQESRTPGSSSLTAEDLEQVDYARAVDTEALAAGGADLGVLATPSPFLYPATPPELPEDYSNACGMMLPPAFGSDGMIPYEMMGFDPMGMPYDGFPSMMYDASTDMYVPCGWGPMGFEDAGAMDPSFLPMAQDLGAEGLPECAEAEVALPPQEELLAVPTDQAGECEQAAFTVPSADEGAMSMGEPVTPTVEETPTWSPGDCSPTSHGGASQAPAQSEESGSSSGTIWSGSGTTVMLRNIPNKYTRDMLVAQLNEQLRGQFDFVYLPIDFKNRCNVGYCFINFRTIEVRERFVEAFNGVEVRKCLPGLNSKKIAEVAPARVHGLDDNVKRLKNSPVMNELVGHPEWMPLIFDEDGAELPFPVPDQPVPAMKPRNRRRQDAEGFFSEGAAGTTKSSHGRKQESGGGRPWRSSHSQGGQPW